MSNEERRPSQRVTHTSNSIRPPGPGRGWLRSGSRRRSRTTRHSISHSAPLLPVNGSTDRMTDAALNTTEPEVVDAHPAVHVAQPPQAHHQDRLDLQIPHDQPQQVADVASRERVQPDPP